MKHECVVALLLLAVIGCARGVENGTALTTAVVQKTSVLGFGSRDIVMTVYTESLVASIRYQLKCVPAGAGCEAPAAGTPVSSVFNKGVNQITGVVQDLDPNTLYDCYVITNQRECDDPLAAQTEPIMYVASWGSLGDETPSGDILACDIKYSLLNTQGTLGPCYPTPSIVNGIDAYPYSTYIQGSKAYSVYYYRPETTGVRVCDITENGTTLTNCTDAYGPQDAGTDGKYVSDIVVMGDKVYLGLESGQVLLCSVLSNGSFADCNSTGPLFEQLLSIYRNNDMFYIVGLNIHVCFIASNGALIDCSLAYSPGSNEPWAMAIKAEYAYITITNGTTPGVLLCSVTTNGTFDDCSITGSGIRDPSGIAIVGNQAIISRYGSDVLNGQHYAKAFTCKIQATGELSNCSGEILYTPSSGTLDISA